MSTAPPMIEIDGRPWFLTVSRNMSLWHQWSSVEGSYHHLRDFRVAAPFEYVSLTVAGTKTSALATPDNIRDLDEKVMSAVGTEEGIRMLRRRYEDFGSDLLRALDVCRNDPTPEMFEGFLTAYRRLTAGLYLTTVIGRRGGELLQQRLSDTGVSAERLADIVNTITYPPDHTPLFLSQHRLLEIGRDTQSGAPSGAAVEPLLTEWLNDHGYIPVNFSDEPWTMEDARQQLTTVLKKDCAQEIAARRQQHQDTVSRGRQLLEEIARPEITTLAHAIQAGTTLNEYRKNVFSRASRDIRPVLQQVAAKAGLPDWHQTFYLLPPETVAILSGTSLPVEKLIAERDIALLKIRNDHVSLLPHEDANRVEAFVYGRQAAQEGVAHTTEVRGQIANRGKARGRVRIVLSSTGFPKFETGDILVTTMTSVDFVPIMEKAAAFVTNEGGITSHASIVSREMNKPCIIGTRNATKVLHDGDEVEVDAEKGIVTILRRAT